MNDITLTWHSCMDDQVWGFLETDGLAVAALWAMGLIKRHWITAYFNHGKKRRAFLKTQHVETLKQTRTQQLKVSSWEQETEARVGTSAVEWQIFLNTFTAHLNITFYPSIVDTNNFHNHQISPELPCALMWTYTLCASKHLVASAVLWKSLQSALIDFYFASDQIIVLKLPVDDELLIIQDVLVLWIHVYLKRKNKNLKFNTIAWWENIDCWNISLLAGIVLRNANKEKRLRYAKLIGNWDWKSGAKGLMEWWLHI